MTAHDDGDAARHALSPVATTPPGAPVEPDAPATFVQFVAGVAVRWTVTEVDARGVPGARGARCLLFSREDCVRRVWHYPADWRMLDAAALVALSWQR